MTVSDSFQEEESLLRDAQSFQDFLPFASMWNYPLYHDKTDAGCWGSTCLTCVSLDLPSSVHLHALLCPAVQANQRIVTL